MRAERKPVMRVQTCREGEGEDLCDEGGELWIGRGLK